MENFAVFIQHREQTRVYGSLKSMPENITAKVQFTSKKVILFESISIDQPPGQLVVYLGQLYESCSLLALCFPD